MQQCIKLLNGHPICPEEFVRVFMKIRICTEIFSFCMDILIEWMYPIFSMTSTQPKHMSGTQRIEVILPYFELAALF